MILLLSALIFPFKGPEVSKNDVAVEANALGIVLEGPLPLPVPYLAWLKVAEGSKG